MAYRVRALNAAGESAYSNIVRVTNRRPPIGPEIENVERILHGKTRNHGRQTSPAKTLHGLARLHARGSAAASESAGQPQLGRLSVSEQIADAFARKFARFHGAKYGLAVANGTIAIEVALKAAGLKPGDEVIVPAYTWEGTVGPILLLNAVPVFVDIDPDTYCLDAHLIEAGLDAQDARHPARPPRHALCRPG